MEDRSNEPTAANAAPQDPTAPEGAAPKPNRRKRGSTKYVISTPLGDLTKNEEAFCQAYARMLSPSAAAIEAKLPRSYGTTLLKKPRVRARITTIQEHLSNTTNITPEFVIGALVKTYRTAYESENHAQAIKALELVGTHLGMFNDRTTQKANPAPGLAGGSTPGEISADIARLKNLLGEKTAGTTPPPTPAKH